MPNDKPKYSALGVIIKFALIEKGMSQQDLSKETKVDHTTISHIIHDTRIQEDTSKRKYSDEAVRKILDGLNIKVDDALCKILDELGINHSTFTKRE